MIGDESLERIFETDGYVREAMSAIIKDETKCIRCALCAERCPTGAITMEAFHFEERLSCRAV